MAGEARACKCGCGEVPSGDREYKWGHKPKALKRPPTQLAKVEPVVEVSAEEEPEEYIEISFTAASLSRLFELLPLHEKAVAVAAALGEEDSLE